MLSLTHASPGALAGEFIPNPYIAFIAGILIHFLMDKIPHFWPESDRFKDVIIALDTLFSVLFILTLHLIPATRNSSIIAGALGGVSVDLYLVLIIRSEGKMAEWHTNRQLHKPQPIWFLSDIVIFSSFVALIWMFK